MRLLLRPPPKPALTAPCEPCHGSGLVTGEHTHRDPDSCSTCMDAPSCKPCHGTGEIAGPGACAPCFSEHGEIFAAEGDTRRCRSCRELDEEAAEAAKAVA